MPTTIGALDLAATARSISVTVNYTGDTTDNNTVAVQFKRSADPSWRDAVALTRITSGSKRWVGSLFYLDPLTPYDVRVTYTDPDGVVGTNPLQGSTTTISDTVPARPTVFDRFLNAATGSNSNDGLGPGTPWRTLDKAMQAAPNGAKVRLAPGVYPAMDPSIVRSTPIEFYGEFPAIDDNGNVINTGSHSIIVGESTIGAATGAWSQTTIDGNTVWRAALPGAFGSSHQVLFGAGEQSIPTRSAGWNKLGGFTVVSPTTFAREVRTGFTYRAGSWVDTVNNDVYLWEGDSFNPNDYYWTIGRADGLMVSASSCRFSGLVFRGLTNGLWLKTGSGHVVDHNLVSGCRCGCFIETPVSQTIVAQNRFVDSRLWQTDLLGIPGVFLNGNYWNYQNVQVEQFVGAPNQSRAFSLNGSRLMLHHNVLDGLADGWHLDGNHIDLYQNVVSNIQHVVANFNGFNTGQVRSFRNIFAHLDVGVQVLWGTGPIWEVENTYWRVGSAGVAPGFNSQVNTHQTGWWWERDSSVSMTFYGLFNTFWSDVDRSGLLEAFALGGHNSIAGYLFGNIARCVGQVWTMASTGWVMARDDFNFWSTTGLATGGGDEGLQFNGVDYNSLVASGALSLAAYRTASGLGANTNRLAGVDYAFRGSHLTVDNALASPATGDLSLAAGSAFRNAGPTTFPNLRDLPGFNLDGVAVDLGATEYGLTTPSVPTAPSGLGAVAVSSGRIDLAWTDNSTDETGFVLQRRTGAAAFADLQTLGPNVTSHQDVTVTPSTTYFYRLRATGVSGDSGYSNEATATTPAAGVPPNPPTTLVAVVTGSSRIDLSWVDAAVNETAYVVSRRVGLSTVWGDIATLPVNSTTYSDQTVKPNTTYFYRVRAINEAGANVSNEATATTTLGVSPSLTFVDHVNGQTIDAAHLNLLQHRMIEASAAVYSAAVYGATGDGSTNDTLAIQTALDAAHANGGGVVSLGAGTFKVNRLVVRARCGLRGVGAGATRLVLRDDQNTPLIDGYVSIDGIEANASHIYLGYLTLDGNAIAQTDPNAHGVRITTNPLGGVQARDDYTFDGLHLLEQVIITRCAGDGVSLSGRTGAALVNVRCLANDGNGFNLTGPVVAIGCEAVDNGLTGFRLSQTTGIRLAHCRALRNGLIVPSPGFLLTTSNGLSIITGCIAESNRGAGFSCQAVKLVSLVACLADSNSVAGVNLSPGFEIIDCDYCHLQAGLSTDKYPTGQADQVAPTQTRALKIAKTGSNTCSRNQVDLTHVGLNGVTVGAGLSTGSNAVTQTGNRIFINGAQQTVDT